MARPDDLAILQINGSRFKKAHDEGNTKGDVIFCNGYDGVNYHFSISEVKEVIDAVEKSPEL